MKNPFENKAIKFATEEELNHLAELARGYGMTVGSCTFEPYSFFRSLRLSNSQYDTFSIPKPTDTVTTYSDFIASLRSTEQQPDMVNHPKHYNVEGYEVIDIIRAFGLNFAMGNVLKYILRADRKGNRLQDLKKAAWYLQNEIDKTENETI
jgi:hypothetical protein